MNQFLVSNECENSQTLTTTTTGSKTHKMNPTIRHAIRQAIKTEFCSPKGPFFTYSWSWMKSSARHTLRNQQAQLQKLRLVNLTENAAITLSRLLVWLL